MNLSYLGIYMYMKGISTMYMYVWVHIINYTGIGRGHSTRATYMYK